MTLPAWTLISLKALLGADAPAGESPLPRVMAGASEPVVSTDGGTSFWDSNLVRILEGYGIEVMIVMVIMFIAWLIAGWAGNAVRLSLSKAKVEATLSLFFGKLIRWGILIMAVLACLQRFGINTTSFAAVLAAAGFAIGLAFQGTLSNFSSGVMLLIFRPFKVGDFIEVSGKAGTVREIDLFTTAIDTLDNRRIILPNGKIFGEVIDNVTHNEERRVDVDVGVHYKEDLDRTREVLLESARGIANRLPHHEPQVVMIHLGSSSVDWQVRIWTNPQHYWQVREDALVAAKKALDRSGLVIPFPQLDVHLNRLD